MKIRTFVAVELPAAERDRLGALQTRLRAHGARVSWPAANNLHVTLAFLGDIDEARVADVVAAVARGAAATPPFGLRVEGAGAFPSLARPRVVWAGLDGDLAALAALQSRIADELAGLGVARDSRPFAPHLTLGRVKEGRDRALRDLTADLARAEIVGDAFEVAEVVVMRSELDPRGARYTPLARVALRAVSGA